MIAYNLGNLWRRLALPKKIGNWSLTSLQQRSPRRDRRTAGETCALLLAAAGRRAAHAAAFWQHAEKDRGAAAAERVHPERVHRERVANQERQRIERSEAILWGEVSAPRLVGGEKQTKPVSGTAQQAGRRGDPPNRGHVDLSLTRKGRLVYGFAQR